MSSNPYSPVAAEITEVIPETGNIRTFRLRPAEPVFFQAGQFIELSIPGVGEAPFTPSSSPAETAFMDVTVMRVGYVTEALHELGAGARVGVRGPLGKPYPLERFHGREVLIVGGGVGLAPLRALLFALFEELEEYPRIVLRYGARSPGDIVYREAVEAAWDRGDKLDVLVTVDEGDAAWRGPVGVVTTILEREHLSADTAAGVAVVCGPPVMMKFSTLKLLEIGYPKHSVYLSMEKNMSCGIGKCGHCRIGPYYACKDGPVFSYDQLESQPRIWD